MAIDYSSAERGKAILVALVQCCTLLHQTLRHFQVAEMSKNLFLLFLKLLEKNGFISCTSADSHIASYVVVNKRDLVSHPLDQWAYYPAVRAELRIPFVV